MENHDEIYLQKHSIHKVLAHSYAMYFVLFLVAVFLDFIFKIRIFTNSIFTTIGIAILIFASILILWAQYASGNLKKGNITKDTFRHGPYAFTRTPTNFGLFFLMLGFGMITNSFFVVVFALASFIIGKFVFLDKEEKILSLKYGAPYLEYKKSVKF